MLRKKWSWVTTLLLLWIINFCATESLLAGELNIGAVSIDMTPPLPVSLDGQMRLRVAEEAQTPLTVSVIALENKDGNKSEISVWVTLELVSISDHLRDMIRAKIETAIPDINPRKIVINATHTHTGPATRIGNFILPDGVHSVEDNLDFITARVVEGVLKAWNSRKPGSVSWGLGQAKVAVNRRAVYYDGSAKMYGKTNLPEFRGLEGYEDHDLNVLFFWDENEQLIATCINVSCPAQEVEGRSAINADFWYPVREQLRERFGEELVVLGWIGAAGDQSPHLMYGRVGEERMRELRGLTRLEELARRIVVSVEDVCDVVQTDKHLDIKLIHEMMTLKLPKRLVTVDALNEAKSAIEEIESDTERRITNYRRIKWHQAIIDRYEQQQLNPDQTYDVEIHLIRLGEVVICTNPFELFTEYGIRMKARSPAVQTFVVQLVGGGTYLPTMEAVRGGHYSAIIQSNQVGPEGGDILVEETVRGIDEIWNTATTEQ